MIAMRAVSAVLPLHFVGKDPKEKKVQKVTQQTADQAKSKSFCRSCPLRTRKFQHVFTDHRRKGVQALFQNVTKHIPLSLYFTC